MARMPLPEGTVTVTIGIVVAGIAAYGFLVLSGRALGSKLYGDLSVLWVLGFLAGPGVFMPLEQEVSRAIAARRAKGLGAQPVLRRAIALGAGMLGLLAIGSFVAAGPITNRLFDHHATLFVAFLICLTSLYVGYVARGYLSGNSRFGAYSVLVAGEGILRLLPVVAFSALGWHEVGPYGLAFGMAPLISAPLVLSRQRRLVKPGPQAPWGELTAALGYLVAASLLTQLLLNLAPLTVKLLSNANQQALAGNFLSGLVLARVPVVLFQAVLAALLPKLARLAAVGEMDEFRKSVRGLLLVVAAVGVLAVAGAVVAGSFALRLLFGPTFVLGRSDFGYLSLASIVFIVALTLGQALIAMRSYGYLTIGWIAGTVGFVAAVALVHPLLTRVEVGFLAGSATSAVVLGAFLLHRLRTGAPTLSRDEALVEEAAPLAAFPPA